MPKTSIVRRKTSNRLATTWLAEISQILSPMFLSDPDIVKRIEEHISKCYRLEGGPNNRSMFFLFNNVRTEYLFASNSTYRVLGYTNEQVKQAGLVWMLSLLSPGELEFKKKCMRDVFGFLKTLVTNRILKCIVRFDIEATHYDGHVVHLLEEMMFPEVNYAGEPLLTSCFLHDISNYENGRQRKCSIYEETQDGIAIIFSKVYHVDANRKIPLSKREVEVLEQFSLGLNTRKVAQKLFVSENTIKSHRKNILLKLDAQNTVEAIKVCIKNRWIA